MKALLIVDVQKCMGNWFTLAYINKLRKFLEARHTEYDKIYMIIEPHYKKLKLDLAEDKLKACEEHLNSFKSDSIPAFILDYLSEPPMYKRYAKDLFNTLKEYGVIHPNQFVKLPHEYLENRDYYMYVSVNLGILVNKLKHFDQVDIVGGGVDKCVRLTNRLLTYNNINTKVLRDTCYIIRYVDSNWKKNNAFQTKPRAGMFEEEFLQSGKLNLVTIPFKGI